MELSESRGKLVAVGGAEDREGECAVLREFVRLVYLRGMPIYDD